MTEQNLNHRQLGAMVEHVGGEAVAKRMGMHRFGDSGAARGLVAGMPDDFVGDGIVSASRLGNIQPLRRGRER